jgi:hypothetical protein
MKTKGRHHPYVKAEKEQKVKDDPATPAECPFFMSLLLVLVVQLVGLKNLEKAQAYNQLYTEAKQLLIERSVKPVAKTEAVS